jgi:hypothetical protein
MHFTTAAPSEMATDLLGHDSPHQRRAVLFMSVIFVTVAVAMAAVGRTRGPTSMRTLLPQA